MPGTHTCQVGKAVLTIGLISHVEATSFAGRASQTTPKRGTVIPAKTGTSSRSRRLWNNLFLRLWKMLGDPRFRGADVFRGMSVRWIRA